MAAGTKKSRRTTGHDAVTTIRLSSELRESVDAWAAKQGECLLRLLQQNLGHPPWFFTKLRGATHVDRTVHFSP